MLLWTLEARDCFSLRWKCLRFYVTDGGEEKLKYSDEDVHRKQPLVFKRVQHTLPVLLWRQKKQKDVSAALFPWTDMMDPNKWDFLMSAVLMVSCCCFLWPFLFFSQRAGPAECTLRTRPDQRKSLWTDPIPQRLRQLCRSNESTGLRWRSQGESFFFPNESLTVQRYFNTACSLTSSLTPMGQPVTLQFYGSMYGCERKQRAGQPSKPKHGGSGRSAGVASVW